MPVRYQSLGGGLTQPELVTFRVCRSEGFRDQLSLSPKTVKEPQGIACLLKALPHLLHMASNGKGSGFPIAETAS